MRITAEDTEAQQYKRPYTNVKLEDRQQSEKYMDFFRGLNQSVYRANGTKYFTNSANNSHPVFDQSRTTAALEREIECLPISAVIGYDVVVDGSLPKIRITFKYSEQNKHAVIRWVPLTSSLPKKVLLSLEKLDEKVGLERILSGTFTRNKKRLQEIKRNNMAYGFNYKPKSAPKRK